jgi:hypothetical protein
MECPDANDESLRKTPEDKKQYRGKIHDHENVKRQFKQVWLRNRLIQAPPTHENL